MRATVAHIDLDALEWNFQTVRRRASGQRLLGMVKANAYGHGIIEISRALQQLGADMLGTAFVDEAVSIRSHGIDTDVLILTPVEVSEAPVVVNHGFHIVGCDLEQLRAVSEHAVVSSTTIPVHLYLDTGMNREGFRALEAVQVAQQIQSLSGLSLVGVCTHFATADDPSSPFLREQLETFTSAVSKLASAGIALPYVHAANSGALWMDEAAHFTMVRPGLALYGYALGAEPEMALRPVLSLHSRINSLRTVWPGETVSYGQRYVVSERSNIVTVPIGYGDGYLRSLTGKAECIISGKRYPIVGSICMDELMVNVGSDTCMLGQDVVLIGQQQQSTDVYATIDAIELAEHAGTIPYEILTAVSARVPRMYGGRLAEDVNTNGTRE